MNCETLVELQDRIYKQNKELGWHDKPRSFNTFVCLFHSELSEAMEGLRKGLMDDHLPHYPMFWVEIADFVIRCMDYLGSVEHVSYTLNPSIRCSMSEIYFLSEMHSQVSAFRSNMIDPYYHTTKVPLQNIEYAVISCFEFADNKGVDLKQIINEKVEYNKTRADHKRENRSKDGGKKF